MWKGAAIWFCIGLGGSGLLAFSTGEHGSALEQPQAAVLIAAPEDAADSSELQISASVTEWKFETVFPLPEVPEPSGLTWCGSRGTMFTVDDGGADRPSALHEISLDGEWVRKLEFGRDLEGVAWIPDDNRLYVCDEADERIWVIDAEPAELALLGSCFVARQLGDVELQAGGNGFEGIAWIPPLRLLAILNQDDPTALLLLDPLAIRYDETIEPAYARLLPQRNSGALHYDPAHNELWVVNSWLNTMAVLDAAALTGTGEPEIVRWEVVPGLAQEGVAMDPQGLLWVAQDIGGIARYVLK